MDCPEFQPTRGRFGSVSVDATALLVEAVLVVLDDPPTAADTILLLFAPLKPLAAPSAARSLRLVTVLEVSDLESSSGRGRAGGIVSSSA